MDDVPAERGLVPNAHGCHASGRFCQRGGPLPDQWLQLDGAKRRGPPRSRGCRRCAQPDPVKPGNPDDPKQDGRPHEPFFMSTTMAVPPATIRASSP
jgi:hypothetical protein